MWQKIFISILCDFCRKNHKKVKKLDFFNKKRLTSLSLIAKLKIRETLNF